MESATKVESSATATATNVCNTAMESTTNATKIISCIAPKTYFSNTKLLSDDQLLKLCQRYGEQTRVWRQKFAGLLPEVNSRKLYEKKGFPSIFEFAVKLAGMSQNQVCRILNLERTFADKPALHQMLINGDVSPNKLIKIAPIATIQNQQELAGQVKILPCRALETLARDEKAIEGQFQRNENDAGGIINYGENIAGAQNGVRANGQPGGESGEYQNGSNKPENDPRFAHVSMYGYPGAQPVGYPNSQAFAYQSAGRINNDIELVAALKNEVKEKLVELKRKGIDINDMIMRMISQRNNRIEDEKQMVAQKMAEKSQKPVDQKMEEIFAPNTCVDTTSACANNTNKESASVQNVRTHEPHAPSRYIPVSVKRVIALEHGEKCSIPNCKNPSETIHHSQRFALNSTHDPRYMAPLCAYHHKIAHSADLNWRQHQH
jgi:hypothetical protein